VAPSLMVLKELLTCCFSFLCTPRSYRFIIDYAKVAHHRITRT
jgi:hypothetical protein